MSLHPLLGHEQLRGVLATAHARGALPAAILLHGPRGVGKQRLALWLAQLLVCERPSPEPCGACRACRSALTLEHPDIHWYFPLARPKNVSGDRLVDALEEARHHALAEIRADALRPSHAEEVRGLYLGTVRNIRARAHKRPNSAAGPVFVIGDAELLASQEASQEAANALLKLLEEPPGGARFILTSSEPGSVLDTIRSRVVPIHVGTLPAPLVAAFLQERRGVGADDAARAAVLGQGSLGRALGFLPVDDAVGPLDKLRWRAFGVLTAATAGSPTAGFAEALAYPPAQARALVDLFAFLEEWVRDLGAVAAGATSHVIHQDALSRLEQLVSSVGVAAVDAPVAFSHIETARELARANVNPQLIMSGLLRDLRSALVIGRKAGATT